MSNWFSDVELLLYSIAKVRSSFTVGRRYTGKGCQSRPSTAALGRLNTCSGDFHGYFKLPAICCRPTASRRAPCVGSANRKQN